MRISERRHGDAVILDLQGPVVGWKSCGQLEDTVRRHAHERRPILVANLGKVPAIDARGLGALVTAHTTMERAGGAFRLAAVTNRIQDMVVLSRLLTFFDTFDTVDDAVSDVRVAVVPSATSPRAVPGQPFWLGMQRLLRRA